MMIICKSYNPDATMMDYAKNITEALAIRDCLCSLTKEMLNKGFSSTSEADRIDAFLLDNLGERAEKSGCPAMVYGEKDIELVRVWLAYHEE